MVVRVSSRWPRSRCSSPLRPWLPPRAGCRAGQRSAERQLSRLARSRVRGAAGFVVACLGSGGRVVVRVSSRWPRSRCSSPLRPWLPPSRLSCRSTVCRTPAEPTGPGPGSGVRGVCRDPSWLGVAGPGTPCRPVAGQRARQPIFRIRPGEWQRERTSDAPNGVARRRGRPVGATGWSEHAAAGIGPATRQLSGAADASGGNLESAGKRGGEWPRPDHPSVRRPAKGHDRQTRKGPRRDGGGPGKPARKQRKRQGRGAGEPVPRPCLMVPLRHILICWPLSFQVLLLHVGSCDAWNAWVP